MHGNGRQMMTKVKIMKLSLIIKFIPLIHNFPIESTVSSTEKISEFTNCKSAAHFWAYVIREELELTKNDTSDKFQYFCTAVILSSIICTKLGIYRRYLDTEEDRRKGITPTINEYRRRLLSTAKRLLNQIRQQKKVILI